MEFIIPKIKTMPSPEMDSGLRGDLIDKKSKLRGSLAEEGKLPAEEHPAPSEGEIGKLRISPEIQRAMDREKRSGDLAVGDQLRQRDGGAIYTVEAMNDTPRGAIVLLRGSTGESLSLRLEDLKNKIATPGEAWERI
ncbi:MAG: hypothetical protein HYZ08_01125 [Candidatus Kerfeldbacteria bacterium]|nr:hypothetical protein [Candidatus Kerfeldbacteria bacterium]